MERIDDLQLKGLKIIQNPQGFCFGIDAVLLANHVNLKPKDRVVDLGTGTGIIPLLLAGKSKTCSFIGLELQEAVFDMAKRSVALNQLKERIEILQGDIKELDKILPKSIYDVVTANPPYMHGEGLINPKDAKAISRHEVACNLEDVIKGAAILLRTHGRFYMVHRPNRLVDILHLMRSYDVEPKELTLIQPKKGKAPNLLIVEGKKGARRELKINPPLILYEEEGKYTKEALALYNQKDLEGL